MKVKEWCIALDNVSSYIDSVLGLRYKFLKGERATKEKVFSTIPSMTEEVYARYFRPATEEEINGEFEWDGEQYVLEKIERMKSIKEKAKEYRRVIKVINEHESLVDTQGSEMFEAGANYVLDIVEKELQHRMLEDYNQGAEEDEIAQGCMASMIMFVRQLKK